MQSNREHEGASRLHVAIIMDGNGRWAASRGLPRIFGHRAGAKAVRRVIESAPSVGIGTLTLFAFSSDNWQRPGPEVAALMRLFHQHLCSEQARCVANGVRVKVIGRRDRLSQSVRAAIDDIELATAAGRTLDLRLAIDYSARELIVEAAKRLNGHEATRDDFARLLGEAYHAGEPVPDVDLVIRTSGEQRLSDFLLWECAYAELYFTAKFWPDFDVTDLEEAVRWFHSRERRYGAVPRVVAG